jgi:hypothetical protein
VTADKLAAGSVTRAAVADGAITRVHVRHGAIAGAQIAPGAVTASDVRADALTGAQIDERTLHGVASAGRSIRVDSARSAALLAGLPPAAFVSLVRLVQAASPASTRRVKGPARPRARPACASSPAARRSTGRPTASRSSGADRRPGGVGRGRDRLQPPDGSVAPGGDGDLRFGRTLIRRAGRARPPRPLRPRALHDEAGAIASPPLPAVGAAAQAIGSSRPVAV